MIDDVDSKRLHSDALDVPLLASTWRALPGTGHGVLVYVWYTPPVAQISSLGRSDLRLLVAIAASHSRERHPANSQASSLVFFLFLRRQFAMHQLSMLRQEYRAKSFVREAQKLLVLVSEIQHSVKKGGPPPLTAADVNYILPYQRKNAKYIPLHVTLTSSIDQECSTILGFGRFTNRLPIARLRSARKTCITFKRQGRRLLYRRTLSTGVLWFSREQLQIWIHNVFLVTRKKNTTNNPSTTIPFDIYLL